MRLIPNECLAPGCTNMVPFVNKKGKPFLRQSKYDERKTCCDDCARVLRQGLIAHRGPKPFSERSIIDQWVCRAG